MDKATEVEALQRANKFLKAMKSPTKRVTSDPNVKHVVHNVDTQGFNPKAKITVDEEIVE